MPGIRPVRLEDLLGLERYEAGREEVRRRTIELKRHRRVHLGDEITLVFENHDTMWFQIQEMLRAEQISDLDAVREELEVYNALLPHEGELSATLFIEITDQSVVRERLEGLIGIDEALWLRIGDLDPIRAEFEPGRSREDRLSAVQYVRFRMPADARRAFADKAIAVRLVVDHENYQAETPIVGATRASLAEDLRTAA